ncbi:hypothetical protein GCM10009557_72040 [Virgisporangium ochraceum]
MEYPRLYAVYLGVEEGKSTMSIIERYRVRREAARRREAIARAINTYPSHALRQELEAMASR